MDEIIIPVSFGGLNFKNPFYVSSGPTARTLKQLKRIEETGWAAASIKLSIDPAPYINLKPRYGYFNNYSALGFTAEKRLTFEEGLKLVSGAKKVLRDLMLFANIAYAGDGRIEGDCGPAGGGSAPGGIAAGWVNMAKKFEECGADAIELNMCCPNMSFNVERSGGKNEIAKKSGASLSQYPELIAAIVREIKMKIKIPVFVKLSPEGGQVAQSASIIFAAGADAVGGTANRLGMPPINLDDPAMAVYPLQKEISMACYSGAWIKPLALRDTYEIRKQNGPDVSIMATGGIRCWQDAAEMILCGADLVGICTETILSGHDIVRPMIVGLKNYMDSHGYKSVADFRGALVPMVKNSSELTVYDGYAQVINPDLKGCGKECALCKKICCEFAPALTDSGAVSINKDDCMGCGICFQRCPRKNIRMIRIT